MYPSIYGGIKPLNLEYCLVLHPYETTAVLDDGSQGLPGEPPTASLCLYRKPRHRVVLGDLDPHCSLT